MACAKYVKKGIQLCKTEALAHQNITFHMQTMCVDRLVYSYLIDAGIFFVGWLILVRASVNFIMDYPMYCVLDTRGNYFSLFASSHLPVEVLHPVSKPIFL